MHIVPTLDESDETETDWDASSDDAPAQESLDVYDTDAPRIWTGRDAERGDVRGGAASGAGTGPDADPVQRPAMGGPLLRRQNARVLRDACTMRDVGRGDAGELDADADPVPRLTMGGPLLRRQNARVIRDAWPDPSSHPARDESAAKKAKTLSHPTGHGAGGVG